MTSPPMANDASPKSELAADAIFDPVELAKRGLRAEELFRLLVESVTDYAIFVLDPTASPSLTLVTCYPFYFVGSAPQRFIVRAVRKVPPGGRSL